MSTTFLKSLLKERGITSRSAVKCDLTELSASTTLQALKGPLHMSVPSVAIVYFDLDGQRLEHNRFRLSGEYRSADGKLAKYLQAAGTVNHLYLPPLIDWRSIASDPKTNLTITEGEFKAIKLCQEGIPSIGIPGVWSWRKRESEESSTLADFNQFEWTGRIVHIVFDSDATTNPQVAKARFALARELYSRKAKPYLIDLPHLPGTMKTGVDDWWVANGKSAKKAFKELLSKAESPFVPRIRSTRELEQMKFAELRWIVPGLISAGLAGLYAKPKIGKSFLALQLAHAVASGTRALGHFETVKGHALVIALEDTDVRIKTRMAKLKLPGIEGLRVTTSWPKGDDAYIALERELQEHPETKLIVIDTLQRFRKGSAGKGQNVYEADYAELGFLKGIADRHGIAILLVHHMRKGVQSVDVFENVSGSAAITGAADTNIVISRERTSTEAVMHVTGRDIEEQDYAARVVDLAWQVVGPAYQYQLTNERIRIMEILGNAGENAMRLKDVADAVSDLTNKKCSEPNARKMLRGLISEGLVDQLEDKRYKLSSQGVTAREDSARRLFKFGS